MKFHKKYFSPHHWLVFLRKQPAHMQHVYALAFSGLVTSILGIGILYFDYGFWHDKYSSKEKVATLEQKNPVGESQSPGQLMGDFFKEASTRINSIKESKPNFLEGKEVYTQESSSTKTMKEEGNSKANKGINEATTTPE